MIEKIEIKNFQAQRYLVIEPSSHITSIIGESDIGKSSTIRALYWFFTNKAPSDFITWGQDECFVEIAIDGHNIKRLRNKRKNVYILDGVEYSCLRQDVPPEIQNILRICRENFQTQYEPSFWFTETGGELAKKLNAIVNLEIVDYFFGEINSRIRSTKIIKEDCERELKKNQEELSTLSCLDQFEKDIQQYERFEQRLVENNDKAQALSKFLSTIIDIEQSIKNKKEKTKLLSNIAEIAKELFDKQNQYSSLHNIVLEIEKKQHTRPFDFDFAAAAKYFEKIDNKRQEWRRLNELIENIQDKQTSNRALRSNLAPIEKELHKAMKGKCPLCGRGGETAEEIIDECCVNYDLGTGEIK